MNAKHPRVKFGRRWVGVGERVLVIAEIGINHNGELDLARRLIDGAHAAGADAVKFQKRTPELCVPREQWHLVRDTPWGRMTYIDYRHRMEFGTREFEAIDRHCRALDLPWFASAWDEPSVRFLEAFDPPAHKAASASLTDHELLLALRRTGRPILLSTGMSTMAEVEEAVSAVGTRELLLAHSESTYPCPAEQLNLRCLATLRDRFPGAVIGYSGHEQGLATTCAAVALGAAHVERHLTLDRSLWGSDHAASLDLPAFAQLVAGIRDVEAALGDGVKRVSASELRAMAKLRRVRGDRPGLEVQAVPAAMRLA
ncbi:MAG TPA: N-acetylneuraminate synthase family protein [Anaeromyxobacteraceae bacterium]|nr:N-acetylneuraminate synthase family protein [Anaeromyxobacteraceae bacterium]